MNLTDTFYVALCMTILILGVVYWFWTQNQYIQRKLNLLENIVFEMKTQIQKGDSPPLAAMLPPADTAREESASKYPPAPSSELGDDEDLLDEEIDDAIALMPPSGSPTLKISEENHELIMPPQEVTELSAELHDDDSDLAAALQPGGVGSGVKETPEADSSAKGNVLEGMTLKELQRLAEQKGINTTRMRKPALIEAIRAHSRPSPFEVAGSAIELS
jgi:hypothetical protein